MSKRSRALLTDHDRDVYRGNVDVDDSTVYEKTSRIRSRVTEELPSDLDILRDANRQLYLDVIDAVLQHAIENNDLDEVAERSPEIDQALEDYVAQEE